MLKKYLLASFALFTLIGCAGKQAQKEAMEDSNVADESSLYLLAGTYTAKGSEGIYVYQLDTISGNSKLVSSVAIADPSYLTLSQNEEFVYAVTESNDLKTDAVSVFGFDKATGSLTFINSKLTEGAAPCYITVDPTGEQVITANYASGSITVMQIGKDGVLDKVRDVRPFKGSGPVVDRQESSHLHCVYYSPDGQYLFANDLGTDAIYTFKVGLQKHPGYLGKPTVQHVKPGSGPRHTVFHPNGKFGYLITEISGDVIAFNYKDGKLTEFQTVKADSLNAQGSGDIQLTPDGRFLYASNRLKGDGVAIFSINQENGELSKLAYQDTGIHPRNMAVTTSGSHLLVACRDSDAVQIYKIDRATGLLTYLDKDITMSMPVCLKFASLK